MLGHLQPSSCSISASAQQSYQQFYCGICKSLRKEKGVLASLMINHELSLNLLALSPFLDNQTIEKTPCPSTAFVKTKLAYQHPVVELASQLSILLGWIKTTDWAFDSGRKIASILEKKIGKWNHQLNGDLSPNLEIIINEYIDIIKTKTPTTVEVEQTSGRLARQLWDELSENVAIPADINILLATLFEQTGKIIFQADAIEDYFSDQEKGLFNPITELISKKSYSTKEAAKIFHKHYTRRRVVLLYLINVLNKKSPLSHEFTQVFLSSINKMNDKVSENYTLIVEGTEPDTVEGFFEGMQNMGYFTQQCCCNDCCQGAKCPCTNCNGCKGCGGCNCGTCDCPTCQCCDSGCDCCGSGNGCCNSSSPSDGMTEEEKKLLFEMMEKMQDSRETVKDSLKASNGTDLDSNWYNQKNIDDIIKQYERDLGDKK